MAIELCLLLSVLGNRIRFGQLVVVGRDGVRLGHDQEVALHLQILVGFEKHLFHVLRPVLELRKLSNLLDFKVFLVEDDH